MIRLNLNKEPDWIDLLPGLRVKVLPPTTVVVTLAGKDAELLALDPPPPAETEDGRVSPAVDGDVRFAIFTKAMARAAIVEWEGVGDAEGNPVAPTPDAIGALLDLHQVNRAFQLHYVARAFVLLSEKKDLAPEPNGSSATAPTTAETATGPARTARAN